MATQLMSEVRKGNIAAAIARSADFYGPGADKTSIPKLPRLPTAGQRSTGAMAGECPRPPFLHLCPRCRQGAPPPGARRQCLEPGLAFAYAPHPLTGAGFIEKAAAELHKASQFTVLPKWMIRLGGVFDRTTAELYEMLYQYESEYIFDSTKFETAYSFQPTPYEHGIRATAKAAIATRNLIHFRERFRN